MGERNLDRETHAHHNWKFKTFYFEIILHFSMQHTSAKKHTSVLITFSMEFESEHELFKMFRLSLN